MISKLFLSPWLPFALFGLFSLRCQPEPVDISPGVSWKLAQHRADYLSDVRYELRFTIPDSLHQKIRGEEVVHFDLKKVDQPVVLDFVEPRESVVSVTKDGHLIPFQVIDEHIVIPRSVFDVGENSIEIVFWAGESSLNRNRDYLYTLFVPDRARFAFPCFDQPNLKARFRLALNTPTGWQAAANATKFTTVELESHWKHTFEETELISTYLFSFVAGKFEIETAERNGRTFNMLHRETDDDKVTRNREAIFDLHASALDWLEQFTGLTYPFGKFDFVLIPFFQYGGMEHPGAILYRASSLLLDESATQNQLLGRASLIAHETAHMWFGDLVTMKWFDDVWMKEVFANFMAAKIVNPSFPEVNHDLRFLLAHYPAAYEVDRTQGTNPIRQPLDNLNEAGTLYGAIIYRKAPIVMKHLENVMGESAFKDGLREYLRKFKFANATWPDLISILDERTEVDLRAWSEVWVEQPGRPVISIERSSDGNATIDTLVVKQTDPAGLNRVWPQKLAFLFGYPDSTHKIPMNLKNAITELPEASGLHNPDFILANGDGLGYGLFHLDSKSLTYLEGNLATLDPALVRGIVWLNLWDAMLEQRIEPIKFLNLTVQALPKESDELNIQRILQYAERAYWGFLDSRQRNNFAPTLERTLWRLLEQASSPRLKSTYLNSFRDIAVTEDGVRKLTRLWQERLRLSGVKLSERDLTRLVLELAVREAPGWDEILQAQYNRISNPDRKERLAFVMPALSNQTAVRDSFFTSLQDPRNRRQEPWVLEGLNYLHHPLRANASEKYILPSLEMLEEIQRTGDIFFPKRWLDATLGGHQSTLAAEIVRDFIAAQRPDYPARLTAKILQSADELFRAADITEQ